MATDQVYQLTSSDNKRALSGKKKKRNKNRNKKSVLMLHDPRVHNQLTVPENSLEDKIKRLLETTLPKARIHLEVTCDSANLDNRRSLRSYLIIGLNAVNRSIKTKSAAAILFDKNIEPHHFVLHSHAMCRHAKIPFMLLEDLREITNRTIGFQCIALGFKFDGTEYFEIISSIVNAFGTITPEIAIPSTSATSVVSQSEIIVNSEPMEPFQYRYRNDRSKRAFIPDNKVPKGTTTPDIIIVKENSHPAAFQPNFYPPRAISVTNILKK